MEPVNEPPVAKCQDVTVPTDPGVCSASTSVDDESYDPDGDSITLTQVPVGPYGWGDTDVTLTVTDDKGASEQCLAIVTAEDNTPPDLTTPIDLIIPTDDPDLCTVTMSIEATAIDICDASPNVTSDAPPFFPLGATTVTFTATDASNNVAIGTTTVTVVDQEPPAISCPDPQVVECTEPNGTLAAFDVTATDNCLGTPSVGCDPSSGSIFPVGSTTITCSAADGSGNTNLCDSSVTVLDNTPPVIALQGEAAVTLECGVDNWEDPGATVSDICDPAVSVVAGGDVVNPAALGVYELTYEATDDYNNSAAQVSRAVTVADTIPPVTMNTAITSNPVVVNTPFTITTEVTDVCSVDVAEYSIGADPFQPMELGVPPEFHVTTIIAEPTVTEICVRGKDTAGNASEPECLFLAVYDPEGGFVTGGGWIQSPEGAYATDPTLTGKANFGFVSRYKKGATTPTGVTEFQFKVADLNFHSDTYDWLVVAGPKAMYKGVGMINGTGNYGFMLTAVDENLTASTEVDLFRIKIWDKDDNDAVVYDNQMEEAEDADPTTAIGGGNIKIHKK